MERVGSGAQSLVRVFIPNVAWVPVAVVFFASSHLRFWRNMILLQKALFQELFVDTQGLEI